VSGDGTHTLYTMVVDAAGNDSGWRADTVTVDHTLNNDTTAPIDDTDVAPAGWQSDDVVLHVAAHDNVGVKWVKVRIGSTTTTTMGDHVDVTISADGET
jgi:hypothetical protein